MGAGLPIQRQILSHGWWIVGDTKMSKSLGNVVDPLALREDFGTDAVRWYLLREMPTGSDASFTPERFMTRYNELSNVLGNLVSRSISMVSKYRDGIVPISQDDGLSSEISQALASNHEAMADYRIHEALAASMDLARAANVYVEDRQPWTQAKDPNAAQELDETLATLMRVLCVLCALFEPVAPGKMAELALRLGLDRLPSLETALTINLAGNRLEVSDPLFPRVEPSWAGDLG